MFQLKYSKTSVGVWPMKNMEILLENLIKKTDILNFAGFFVSVCFLTLFLFVAISFLSALF